MEKIVLQMWLFDSSFIALGNASVTSRVTSSSESSKSSLSVRASSFCKAEEAPIEGWQVSIHIVLNPSQSVLSSVRTLTRWANLPNLRDVRLMSWASVSA